MSDLICDCDVVSYCVLKLHMGQISVFNKIVITNQKNRKYGNKEFF